MDYSVTILQNSRELVAFALEAIFGMPPGAFLAIAFLLAPIMVVYFVDLDNQLNTARLKTARARFNDAISSIMNGREKTEYLFPSNDMCNALFWMLLDSSGIAARWPLNLKILSKADFHDVEARKTTLAIVDNARDYQLLLERGLSHDRIIFVNQMPLSFIERYFENPSFLMNQNTHTVYSGVYSNIQCDIDIYSIRPVSRFRALAPIVSDREEMFFWGHHNNFVFRNLISPVYLFLLWMEAHAKNNASEESDIVVDGFQRPRFLSSMRKKIRSVFGLLN